MIIAKLDGPAISGIAKGTINGSPPGVLPNNPPSFGNTILMAIKNNTMPPPIRIASCDTCKNDKIYGPNSKNINSTTYAINNSRRKTKRRRSSGTCFNTDKNKGMFPSGSITKNSKVAAAKISICFSIKC